MNNERDFVNLDKAVKDYQTKKPATGVARPKPTTRGRFMDMVRPGAQAVAPRPAVRSSNNKPNVTPTQKVTAKNGPITTKRRMDMVMSAKKAPTPTPKPKVTEAPKPVKAVAPESRFEEALKAGPKEKTEKARPNLFSDDDFAKEEKAPNANNFSIGGRSPFIRDAKVDKRPLGPNVPESNAGAIRSTKNVYSQKTPLKAGADSMPGRSVITVAAPKKKSGWLWAALTVGIIAVGGGIGWIAYMIFANN